MKQYFKHPRLLDIFKVACQQEVSKRIPKYPGTLDIQVFEGKGKCFLALPILSSSQQLGGFVLNISTQKLLAYREVQLQKASTGVYFMADATRFNFGLNSPTHTLKVRESVSFTCLKVFHKQVGNSYQLQVQPSNDPMKTLEEQQAFIGGYIDRMYLHVPHGDSSFPICIYLDDEGLFKEELHPSIIFTRGKNIEGMLKGNLLVLKDANGRNGIFSEEEMKSLSQFFKTRSLLNHPSGVSISAISLDASVLE